MRHAEQVGAPRLVHDQPANKFVAEFIGSPAMNLFPGTVEQLDGHLVLLGRETDPYDQSRRFLLPLGSWQEKWFGEHLGRSILLGVRAAAIRLLSDPAAAKSGDLMDAVVLRSQFTGSQTLCTVTWCHREFSVSADANAKLTAGQKVVLRMELSNACVFDAVAGVALF